MAKLKHPKRVVLSNSDAHAILTWLLGRTNVKAKDFTKEDCGFAQALLVEMLDGSFKMGFVEALFRAAAKTPSGPVKVIKSFLKGAGKNLVKYKDKDDLKEMIKEPVIYKNVQAQMASLSKSVWRIREATGTLTY